MQNTKLKIDDKEHLKEVFAKAVLHPPKRQAPKDLYMTEEEWEQWEKHTAYSKEDRIRDGAKLFKRRALGVCGREKITSMNELVDLLISTNIAQDSNQTDNIIPDLDGLTIDYSYSYGIGFTKVRNFSGDVKYKIYRYKIYHEQEGDPASERGG